MADCNLYVACVVYGVRYADRWHLFFRHLENPFADKMFYDTMMRELEQYTHTIQSGAH